MLKAQASPKSAILILLEPKPLDNEKHIIGIWLAPKRAMFPLSCLFFKRSCYREYMQEWKVVDYIYWWYCNWIAFFSTGIFNFFEYDHETLLLLLSGVQNLLKYITFKPPLNICHSAWNVVFCHLRPQNCSLYQNKDCIWVKMLHSAMTTSYSVILLAGWTSTACTIMLSFFKTSILMW